MFHQLFIPLLEPLNIKFDVKTASYSYNIKAVKEIMPNILQIYFASKIQKKFKLVFLQTKFSFLKLFCLSSAILLNTNISLFSNIYFEKKWYLIRDQFLLKVVILSYPKTVNRSTKKVINLSSLL